MYRGLQPISVCRKSDANLFLKMYVAEHLANQRTQAQKKLCPISCMKLQMYQLHGINEMYFPQKSKKMGDKKRHVWCDKLIKIHVLFCIFWTP